MSRFKVFNKNGDYTYKQTHSSSEKQKDIDHKVLVPWRVQTMGMQMVTAEPQDMVNPVHCTQLSLMDVSDVGRL
jgi:hypothetical protein